MDYDFEPPSARVSRGVGIVDDTLHALLGIRIHAVQQHLVLCSQSFQLLPCGRSVQRHAAKGHHVAEDLDAEFPEQEFREASDRHARRSLASRSAL